LYHELQDAPPFGVDGATLIVHHFIVFKYLFADVVVIGFDLFLSTFEAICQHFRLDRHIFFDAEGIHQGTHPIAAEDLHQRIF